MVQSTASPMDLARISVVVFPDGDIVMDTLVLPSSPVIDYVSAITGFSAETFSDKCLPTQAQVRTRLRALIQPHDILCGHHLAADLRAIGISHPHVVDTALLFPHPDGPPLFHPLHYLARKYAHTTIQNGTHSSTEDALAVNKILCFYLSQGFLKAVWDCVEETFEPTLELLHTILSRHCSVLAPQIRCIYLRGSRAIGTATVRPTGKPSDWDFVVVVDAAVVPDTLYRYGNVDLVVYNSAYFTRLVQDHIIWALECIFGPPHAVWLETIDFRAVLHTYQNTIQRPAWLPLLRASVGMQCARKLAQARRLAGLGHDYQAAKYLFIAMRFAAYGISVAATGRIASVTEMNPVWDQMYSDLARPPGPGASDGCPATFPLAKYLAVYRDLEARFKEAAPKIMRNGGFRGTEPKAPAQSRRNIRHKANAGSRGDGAVPHGVSPAVPHGVSPSSNGPAKSTSDISMVLSPDSLPPRDPPLSSQPSSGTTSLHTLIAALTVKFPPGLTHECPRWLYDTFLAGAVWSTACPTLLQLHYTPRSPSHPWVGVMRGLVLDSARGWAPVAYPMDRFYSYGQACAAAVDTSTARVYEKLDGSFLMLYHYQGAWRVASSTRPDGDGLIGGRQVSATGLTFAGMFWQTWRAAGHDTARLSPTVCYVFELTSPDHVIIVRHAATRLTLVAARDMATLGELPVDEVAAQCGLFAPASRPLHESLGDLAAEVAEADANLTEGVVVVDAQFRRVKIKARGYLRMMWLFPLCTSEIRSYSATRLLSVVQEGETAELLLYCPELAPRIQVLQLLYDGCIEYLTSLRDSLLLARTPQSVAATPGNPDNQTALPCSSAVPAAPSSAVARATYARAVRGASSDRIVRGLLFALREMNAADALRDLQPKVLLALLHRVAAQTSQPPVLQTTSLSKSVDEASGPPPCAPTPTQFAPDAGPVPDDAWVPVAVCSGESAGPVQGTGSLGSNGSNRADGNAQSPTGGGSDSSPPGDSASGVPDSSGADSVTAPATSTSAATPLLYFEVGVVGLGPAGLAALRATHQHGITAIGLEAGVSLDVRAAHQRSPATACVDTPGSDAVASPEAAAAAAAAAASRAAQLGEQTLACGVGGASLWSDGKFSFLPAGAATAGLRHASAGIAVAEDWLRRAGGVIPADSVSLSMPKSDDVVGVEVGTDKGSETKDGTSGPVQWRLKPYASVKTSFAGRLAFLHGILAELAAPSPAAPQAPSPITLVHDCGPVSARWNASLGLWVLTPASASSLAPLAAGATSVHVRHLVFCGGRLSPLFLRCGLVVSPELQLVPRRLEAGVRLLGPSQHRLFANSTGLLDPKWTMPSEVIIPSSLFASDGPSDSSVPSVSISVEYRTFCWCADGDVLLCDLGPSGTAARLWSGSTDTVTASSNLGLMARVVPSPTWPASLASALQLDTARLEAMRCFAVPWGTELSSHLGPVWGAILEEGLRLFSHSQRGSELLLSDGAGAAMPAAEGLQVLGPCVEGVGLYPRVCPATLAAIGPPHLSFAGDCCGLFRGLVAAIVSGTTAGLEAVAAVSPPPLTGMVAPALQEIHIFLGPIDPDPETVQRYVDTVDGFNTVYAEELAGKRQMKPCHLALEFRLLGRYVRVLQSARYFSCNDTREVIRQAYTRDVPHFLAAGFEVIRVKIEASVHGINEMPVTATAAATTLAQGRYFEHHIRLCRAERSDDSNEPLDAAELALLAGLRAGLEAKLAVPVPLSYNNTGDAQRYCNLRFRGVTAAQALQWVRAVGQTVREELPSFRVVKSIDELVWHDTFTGLDRGWIDPTATRVILLTGKRCSGKDTLAALLTAELAHRGVHTKQLAFADTMKTLYREVTGVDVTQSREVKEQHRAAMSALYHQTVHTDPERFAALVADQIRQAAVDSTRATAIVVSDLRFRRDLTTVCARLCSEVQHAVVRVQASDASRSQRGWVRDAVIDTDPTETDMDTHACDHVITNDGSLQDLQASAHQLVDRLRESWI